MVLAIFGIKWTLHWTVLAFAVLGAIIPDLDHAKSTIGKLFPLLSKPIEQRYGHRMVTHSFLGWGVITIILGIILALLHLVGFKSWSSGMVNWRWVAAFSIGYLSHLMLDMLNIRGVPLFWPEKLRFVLFKNPRLRMESGSRFEVILIIIFAVSIFLALPLSKYGLMSSLRWMLATSGSAIEEYKAADKVSLVEFTGYFTVTKQAVEKGVAEILGVENRRLIVLYKGGVYTLSDEMAADIMASKVRVKRTNRPLKVERKEFENKSREYLEAQIPKNALVTGTVHLPRGLKLKFPSFAGGHQRLSQKGNDLILSFADKKLIQELALTEQFELEMEKDRAEIAKLQLAKRKITSKIRQLQKEDDGLTPLGRELLLSKEEIEKKKQNIAELQSQLAETNLKIKEVQLRLKSRKPIFSGTVYLRK